MTYNTLKNVRFIVPGALLYALLVTVGWATDWFSLPIPKTIEEITKPILAVIFAFVYRSTNLGERMNEVYFDIVNRNLVSKLTAPFVGTMNTTQLTWRNVRPIFYHYVDNDPSLTHQTQRAFFNGALWTSAADLRAISLIGVLIFIAVLLVGNLTYSVPLHSDRTVLGIISCLALFSISFVFSHFITLKHIRIGDDQVEHILATYRDDLRRRLSDIA